MIQLTMISANAPQLAENIEIGLSELERKSTSDHLGEILSDQNVLYIKLRNFHWNLIGPRFHSLHEFFEKQYRNLEAAIDQTAERIRMLGGISPGSMAGFLKRASLKEHEDALIHGDDAIEELIRDNEACIRKLRESIRCADDEFNDAGTADFLVGLLRQHEMDAWMLRSFVEHPSSAGEKA